MKMKNTSEKTFSKHNMFLQIKKKKFFEEPLCYQCKESLTLSKITQLLKMVQAILHVVKT